MCIYIGSFTRPESGLSNDFQKYSWQSSRQVMLASCASGLGFCASGLAFCASSLASIFLFDLNLCRWPIRYQGFGFSAQNGDEERNHFLKLIMILAGFVGGITQFPQTSVDENLECVAVSGNSQTPIGRFLVASRSFRILRHHAEGRCTATEWH